VNLTREARKGLLEAQTEQRIPPLGQRPGAQSLDNPEPVPILGPLLGDAGQHGVREDGIVGDPHPVSYCTTPVSQGLMERSALRRFGRRSGLEGAEDDGAQPFGERGTHPGHRGELIRVAGRRFGEAAGPIPTPSEEPTPTPRYDRVISQPGPPQLAWPSPELVRSGRQS